MAVSGPAELTAAASVEVLFEETFDARALGSNTMLPPYSGSPRARYTSAPYWGGGDSCAGLILDSTTPRQDDDCADEVNVAYAKRAVLRLEQLRESTDPAVNAAVTGTLHERFTFMRTEPGECTTAEQDMACSIGTVVPGDAVEVRLITRAATSLPVRTMAPNAASVRADTPDADPANNIAAAKGVASGLLPPMLRFVSNQDDCTAQNHLITCPPSALASGASMSDMFAVRLDTAYVINGQDIMNQAIVSSNTPDPDLTNITSAGNGTTIRMFTPPAASDGLAQTGAGALSGVASALALLFFGLGVVGLSTRRARKNSII